MHTHCTHNPPTLSSPLSLSLSLKKGNLVFLLFLPAIGNCVCGGGEEKKRVILDLLVLCWGSGGDVVMLSNASVNLFLLKQRGVLDL